MIMKFNYFEIIGIFATIFILIGFMSSNIKVVRVFNIIGSILFVIYGVAINAMSTWLLNGLCIILNVYKIYKENKSNLKSNYKPSNEYLGDDNT